MAVIDTETDRIEFFSTSPDGGESTVEPVCLIVALAQSWTALTHS
jgi:hypothetical protein